MVQAEAGKPVIFKATVQVPPEVTLGDYRNFNFSPEIETIDDAKVDKVIDELRDQNAALTPAERPAEKGDYAIIAYRGTRDGEPFEGGTTDRMPLVIGEERLIPGFEDHLVGVPAGGSTEFDITFPDDYAEPALAGKQAHFEVDLKDLRAKVLPEADDEFAHAMGDYATLDLLREDVKARLERNALDRARHTSATGSSSTRSPTPPWSCRTSSSTRRSRSCTASSGAPSPARGSPRTPISPRPSRPRPSCTPSSGHAPRRGSRRSSSSPRSPTAKGSS